jgi:hypothetical protein
MGMKLSYVSSAIIAGNPSFMGQGSADERGAPSGAFEVEVGVVGLVIPREQGFLKNAVFVLVSVHLDVFEW